MGLFEIVERVGEIAYHLTLPPQLSSVHNVFHISMLYRCNSDPLRQHYPNPSHVIDWTELPIGEDASYEKQPIRITERKDRLL